MYVVPLTNHLFGGIITAESRNLTLACRATNQ